MTRSWVIVALVAVLMATGVTAASPIEDVRLPMEPSPAENSSVTVLPGDHLWKISARHLDEEDHEIDVAPYWREVIDENTPRLRSGDPDLIYPGEVIELPEISGRP